MLLEELEELEELYPTELLELDELLLEELYPTELLELELEELELAKSSTTVPVAVSAEV